jgi:signal transduction histidine kinase
VTSILPRRLRAVVDTTRPSRDPDRAFVAAVSHELRSPLASILGYGDALADGLAGPLSPMQAEFVDVISRSGRHLLDLVDDVVLLTALETRTLVPRVTVTDVAALVSRITLDHAPDAALGCEAIEIDVPDAGLAATADPEILARAVVNLVANAVRLTPAGGTALVRAVSARAGVEISVVHPGADPGSGLAPAVARAVAEAHGGRLTVTAGSHGGCTLAISIPHTPHPHTTEDSP